MNRHPATTAVLVVMLLMATCLSAKALSPEANRFYQQAVVAERANKLEQAEYLLNQAITLDPGDPLNHIKLGNILSAQGRYDRALSAYQRAAANDANDATLYYSIGALHEQLNQLPQARAAYETALRKQPDYLFGLFSLGRVLARQGEEAKAISVYERFLTAYPNHGKAKRYLAGLYYNQQKPEKTIQLLQALKQEDPGRFSDYWLLAEAHNAALQPRQALAVLEEAKQKGLTMAVLSEAAANAQERLGDTKAAISSMEEALMQDPDNLNNRLRLAQWYRDVKSPQKALVEVRQYLIKEPGNLSAQYLQANALLDLAQYEPAAQVLSQLSQQLPASAPAAERSALNRQLAYAYQQSGQPAKAIDLYEGLRQQGVEDPELTRNLAIAYHQQGNLEKALPLYRALMQDASRQAEPTEKITLLRQDYGKVLLSLANQKYEAKDLAQAEALYQEAATQQAMPPLVMEEALLGLANTAFTQGQLDKARTYYTQVLTANPTQPTAQLFLSRLDIEAGQSVEAAVARLQPLTQHPTLAADAWMSLGQGYEQLKKTAMALDAYEQAHVRMPGQVAPLLAKGELFYDLQQPGEAEKAFEQVLRIEPANAAALYNRASIRLGQGKLAQAEADYQAALLANPSLVDARYGLAVLYDRQKQPAKAMVAYQAYLEAAPEGTYITQVKNRLAVLKKQAPAVNPASAVPSGQPLPATTGQSATPVQPPSDQANTLPRLDPV